jgi:group I intron endonuclease
MSVYKITNNLDGKAYIGQTVNSLNERFRTHCAAYSKGKCPKLWNAIQKHGKDNFKMELLWSVPGCSTDELDAKEVEMIRHHNTLDPTGYNIMEGGHASRHHPESRKKISEAKKKLWNEKGDEIRAQIKERGVSAETRQKMSEGCIKKYQEHPELKEHCKHRAGTTPTEETRAKMVKAWERRREDPNFRQVFVEAAQSRRKPVYIFDINRKFIEKFESLAKAAEFCGVTNDRVSATIKTGSICKRKYYMSYTDTPPPEIPRFRKTSTGVQQVGNPVYCFDVEGTLVDTCRSLVEVHEKTGFSISGMLKNAIRGGNLYKKQFYFSYSAEPPAVPTRPATCENGGGL